MVKNSMRLLLILLFGLAARAQDIEHALQKQYEKQIFALRHPLQGSTQEYDSDGQVLKGNTEGPWTVYGYLKIEKLALRADIVQLEGSRVEYRFSDTPKQHASPKITKHVTVRIRLQKIPGSLDEANLVMGRVFALTKRDLLDSRPEIWRQYLDNDTFLPLLGDKPAAVSADQPSAEDRPQQTNTSASGAHEAARTTLKVK